MIKRIQTRGRIAGGMRVAGVIAALVAGTLLTGCPVGSDSSGLSACQQANTAQVSFRNGAGGIANMYVDWDGIDKTGTLTDGATSPVYTVSAISHYMVFRISGGVSLACNGTYVTPAQCSSTLYTCSG